MFGSVPQGLAATRPLPPPPAGYLNVWVIFLTGPYASRYIHGIQMLPLTPALMLARTPEFNKLEWRRGLQPLAAFGGFALCLLMAQLSFFLVVPFCSFFSPLFRFKEQHVNAVTRTMAQCQGRWPALLVVLTGSMDF